MEPLMHLLKIYFKDYVKCFATIFERHDVMVSRGENCYGTFL